jgi:hypothetical protein
MTAVPCVPSARRRTCGERSGTGVAKSLLKAISVIKIRSLLNSNVVPKTWTKMFG